MSQEFRFKKNIDETIFFDERKENQLMGKKHNNICATLNYTENFLASTIIGFISIFAFASLAGITIATITAEFNKYKSIIKKKEKEAW